MKKLNKNDFNIIMLYQITATLYHLSGRVSNIDHYREEMDKYFFSMLVNEKINLNNNYIENILLKSWRIYQDLKDNKFKLDDKTLENLKKQIKKYDIPEEMIIDSNDNLSDSSLGQGFIILFEKTIQEYDEYDDEGLNIIRFYISLSSMETDMEKYIKNEEYEKAAKLRDEIKEKKKKLRII